MGFLGDLANSISSQFNLGENTTSSLDTIVDGQQVKYGSLGDFATKFDQSAERKYVEEGYLRRDPYNTDSKQFQVLWQEPNATVLVKKRMFSSIAENYRPDFMDVEEKLYYKAMHVLFQNKCTQIAALEQLGKIQKITAAVGNITQQLVPAIITLADIANNGFGNGGNAFGLFPGGTNPATTQDATNFFKTVDRLRVLYAYNQTAPYTTWLTDSTNLYQSTFGTGSGVIEITNFTSISTSSSVDIRTPGNFQISIADPYQAMLITDYDIEVALSDASNIFYNNKTFQFGVTSINQVISDQQSRLNSMRRARNASPITFNVNPNTLLGKRVTVIIDRLGVEIPFQYNSMGGPGIPGLGGFGKSVTVPTDYLRGGVIAGYDGLDDVTAPSNDLKPLIGSSELTVFNTIITSIFQQLQLLANSANNFTSDNNTYNYARKKLRFNFSGKLIIQPMDVVHIYMSSKSQFDNKILAGLQQMFSGFGILQNITNTLTSLTNATDTLFNPSGNIAVAAEKAMYVGPSFPNYLWALMRNQFVTEIEGTHVFAGVVESAVDNWSDGHFTMNIGGKDNTFYFDQGKVNFKPGADAFNGLIFDPLTPFKSNFDSITNNSTPNVLELLDENKYILSEKPSTSLVKYKLGSLAGQKATSANYIQDQGIDPTTGRLTRVFYAPDGLVYKWKQGIGVFTQNGSSFNINDPSLVGSPNVYAEPFAGLDVMNVLSLLVTGLPYNYATYYKATANLFGFSGDPQSRQSASYSYIASLRVDLAKNNTLWGNFIPFKNLVMNESAIAQAMQAQLSATNVNSDLDSKLLKFADLQNSVTALNAVNALSLNISNAEDPTVAAQISNLQSQISNLTNSINQSITAIQAETKQFYNQIDTSQSYDSNYVISGKNDPSDNQARKLLRKQTNYLTRRMSYDVRANVDKNLFIVDDYYDIDYDIAAFNKSLSDGIKLYSTEFTSVAQKIMNVSDLLNLEVFADSQGHIRVRPPQYNRMPSSVFNRMMYLKQTLGVQIFPQFLNKLLTDQLTSLRQQIEILEDQIRLDCAILGQYDGTSPSASGDVGAQLFILTSSISSGKGSTFSFISDYTDTITDISNLIAQANQDVANSSINQGLSQYSLIKAAGTATKQLFTNAERYSILFQALQAQNQSQGGTNTNNTPTTSIFQSTLVQQLITRISTKSGQSIVSADYLISAGPNQPLEVDTGQTVDLFKVTNELSTYINQWQTSIKAFYHTIKNAAEYKSLDQGATTSNALQNPGIFNNAYIPQVYEHMIEDETYDDYGLNSGTRYIIKNSQIKSLTISENAPAWTTVEVQGTLAPFKENQGPVGLNNFPGGGNGLVTALAIDYDMWRNYGFKEPNVVKVPFLSDPVSQCGPYAAMILTRNRSNILRGSCTISGNEFMQVGEVVYLEDRNLLFYVNSVKHSFQEGSGFTTTLDLTYGHSIGEYIPTYLDTVGKIIYKNQDTFNTIIQRQDSSSQEQNLGVVQLDGKNPTIVPLNTGSENQNADPFSNANTTVVNNILYTTAYVINSNNTAGNNVQAGIELRLYYDNTVGSPNDNLNNVAKIVKQALTGQIQGPMNSPIQNQPVNSAALPDSAINIVAVNMDDESDRRSPSQQAIDAARNQMANTSINTGSTNPTSANNINSNNTGLRTALFSYIIDCWIIFTQVPSTISSNSTADPGY